MLSTKISVEIMRVLAVVISLTIHEFAHGLISNIQGDKTPDSYGRLTLNPAAHIDLFGLLALYLFGFGWAKPVPINSKYYKYKRFGIIITSLAGPLSNFLLMIISTIMYFKFDIGNDIVKYFFIQLIFINASLVIFNMIPIPPLDGSKIIGEIFGGRITELMYRINRFGTLILLIIIWLPYTNAIISKAVSYVANFPASIIFHQSLF